VFLLEQNLLTPGALMSNKRQFSGLSEQECEEVIQLLQPIRSHFLDEGNDVYGNGIKAVFEKLERPQV